jgi:four helix bundle protein
MGDGGCAKTGRSAIIRYSTRRIRRNLGYMRKLDRLIAWRVAQDLAYTAYMLTLDHRIAKHFALIDQIRRAALSIPANIAEGYSLGTTPQFLKGLKIALGSNTELYSHLTILEKLDIVPRQDVRKALEPCSRSIALIIGLVRTLSARPRMPAKLPSPRYSS